MGLSITWCAVREEHADEFFEALDLSPTGETEEIPESLISSASLDTGWRVLWYGEYGCPFMLTKDLQRLSVNHDVLVCLVEEHVMASSAQLWSRGARKWWISHEGVNGPKGLSTGGELPGSLDAIREKYQQLQIEAGGDHARVDYIFEIPLMVARDLVGFNHHDYPPNVLDGHFIVLERTKRARGGWRSRIFGNG